jgi:hypothetical protein
MNFTAVEANGTTWRLAMSDDSKGWPGNGRARRPASRKTLDDLRRQLDFLHSRVNAGSDPAVQALIKQTQEELAAAEQRLHETRLSNLGTPSMATANRGEDGMGNVDERYWQRQEAKHRRYVKWVEDFYKLRDAAIQRDGLEAVERMERENYAPDTIGYTWSRLRPLADKT